MKIVVIDGQGGKLGQKLVEALRARLPDAVIAAIGTNATASSAMLRGGATYAASGENAVAVACRSAGIIVGPIGIVIADALWGEVSPVMAAAVGQSGAVRILVPVNKCENIVAGVPDRPVGELIEDAAARAETIFRAAVDK